MRFADIIGQQQLKRQLVESIERGRISHAQLFSGAAGAGTLPLALAYAQYLNCQNRHDGDSCGECPSCIKMQQLAHPDLHFVFPVNKQGKKSDEVVLSGNFMDLWREIVSQTGGEFTRQQWNDRLDFESEYKIMVIWQPESMNDEAANKILKILEEPWQKTIFLLITERADLLLPTIISRTQEVAVPRLMVEDLIPLAGCDDRLQAANMARLAAGDVIEMRRIAGGGEDALRHDCFDLFCRLMRLSYNDKHLELMDWADEVATLPREQQRALLIHSARLLRESYMLHAGLGSISYLWGEEADFCNKFAPFIGNQNVEFILEQIELAMRQVSQNGNSRIIFTHFALAVSKTINRLK